MFFNDYYTDMFNISENALNLPYNDVESVINNAFIIDTLRRSNGRRTARLDNGDVTIYYTHTRGDSSKMSRKYIEAKYEQFQDFAINPVNTII